jgi:hypothetical protein
MLKFVTALAIIGLAGSAQAITVCDGSGGPGTGVPAGDSHFVKKTFTVRCSANVHLAVQEDATGTELAAAANSYKGTSTYGATSNGGGVRNLARCTVSGGCTMAEAETATAGLLP